MLTLRNSRMTLRAWTMLPAIILAACSTIPRDFETPKVSIANIVPKDVTFLEQRFDVQLRIQNPNNFDLGINGVRFDIDLNQKEFGHGLSGAKITVLRFGSETLTGEVITGLGSILRQAEGFNTAGGKVQYRLKGKAFAESPSSFVIPFEDSGEIDLSVGSADKK